MTKREVPFCVCVYVVCLFLVRLSFSPNFFFSEQKKKKIAILFRHTHTKGKKNKKKKKSHKTSKTTHTHSASHSHSQPHKKKKMEPHACHPLFEEKTPGLLIASKDDRKPPPKKIFKRRQRKDTCTSAHTYAERIKILKERLSALDSPPSPRQCTIQTDEKNNKDDKENQQHPPERAVASTPIDRRTMMTMKNESDRDSINPTDEKLATVLMPSWRVMLTMKNNESDHDSIKPADEKLTTVPMTTWGAMKNNEIDHDSNSKQADKKLIDAEAKSEAEAETSTKPLPTTYKEKPELKFFVRTGYKWNGYNRIHYSYEQPPPKRVLGYKFEVSYPQLANWSGQSDLPSYELLPCEDATFELLVFRAPDNSSYRDVCYRIVRDVWDTKRKRRGDGFVCQFYRGVFKLYFNFYLPKWRR